MRTIWLHVCEVLRLVFCIYNKCPQVLLKKLKINRLRLSANTKQRGKESLGWKGNHLAKLVLDPCIPYCWAGLYVHRPAHCIYCFFEYQGRAGSFFWSTLRNKTHVCLKGYISLCSLIWYSFNLGLQRQTKKNLHRQSSLSLYHDCCWHIHVYICTYIYWRKFCDMVSIFCKACTSTYTCRTSSVTCCFI